MTNNLKGKISCAIEEKIHASLYKLVFGKSVNEETYEADMVAP